ncbi:uncharacterized protein LOC143219551 [Lasioglossum baleicum]|uniref:uncharacterized protein LOC143219551 n=1 Tax=Lasioglossum baleicum TaxID=434251 RepID=UPI003FCE8383
MTRNKGCREGKSIKNRMAALRRLKLHNASTNDATGTSNHLNEGQRHVVDTNTDVLTSFASTSDLSADTCVAINEQSIVKNASSATHVSEDEGDVLTSFASTSDLSADTCVAMNEQSIVKNASSATHVSEDEGDVLTSFPSTSDLSADTCVAMNEQSIVKNASSATHVSEDEGDVPHNNAFTLESVSATLPATIVDACLVQGTSSEMQYDTDDDIENIVLHDDGNIVDACLVQGTSSEMQYDTDDDIENIVLHDDGNIVDACLVQGTSSEMQYDTDDDIENIVLHDDGNIVDACLVQGTSSEMQYDTDDDIENIVLHDDGNIVDACLVQGTSSEMQYDTDDDIENIVLHDDGNIVDACLVQGTSSEMQYDTDDDIENIVLHDDGNIVDACLVQGTSSEMQYDTDDDIENIVLHDDGNIVDACLIQGTSSEMQNDTDDDIQNIVLHEDANIDADRLRSADMSGRSIASVEHIFKELQKLNAHCLCQFDQLVITKAIRHGLKTQFFVECRMCHFQSSFWNEPTDDKILDVNTGAIIGAILTGTGHAQLDQLMAAMDVKFMSGKTYGAYEKKVSEAFARAAEAEMRAAGEAERQLAIQRGDVINGIPHIPVRVDGSWMKRSYSSFNSPAGTALIIGAHTGLILFFSVRNKYCCICARAANNGTTPKEHVCYKNWGVNQSSSSMESDIILEGFECSIEMHGLMYSKYVGDGDSSVQKRLTDFPPYAGILIVEKVECKNHLLRNVSKKVNEAGNYGARKFSKEKKAVRNSVMKFRNAITMAATFHRESNVEWKDKIAGLIRDLDNVPSHIFGEHKDCASYFCNGVPKANEANLVPKLQEAGIYGKLQYIMQRMKANAASLLHNLTSNIVESRNAIICKLIGGKRTNLAQRGSYQTRVQASVVQTNSSAPISKACNALGKEPPARATVLEKKNIAGQAKRNERLRAAKESGLARRKSRYSDRSRGPDKDYGPNAEKSDVTPEVYEGLKADHYRKLEHNHQHREVFEHLSRGQHEDPMWHAVRKVLLTASNFGKVCSLRDTTSRKRLTGDILHPPELTDCAPVQWGKDKEKVAREELEIVKKIEIQDCGLFIDEEFPYLGATPDGTYSDDTIVEIKCPYAARHMTPNEAIMRNVPSVSNIFDRRDDSRLNVKHMYYFQVQGQLHVTQRQYCIFAVWTPFGIKHTTVERDDEFWKEKMLQPLQRFYEDCLIPEIVDSRKKRRKDYREPQYVIEAQEAAKRRKV